MEKAASTDYPVHELIRQRWSPRAFSNRLIDPQLLCSLFEAARWAPSAYNDQPWSFVIAARDEADEFKRLLGCLSKANQTWAKEAAALLIAIARTRFAHDGSSNRHALYDTGQAVAIMSVQATALGIRVHQMGGFNPQAARELYRIPDEYEPMTAVALGYPGDPGNLPQNLREMELAPRTRRSVSDFVHSASFASSSALLQKRDG